MIDKMTAPYVLFDRDGTLIRFQHYLIDPKKVEIAEGVLKGLQLLKEQGFSFGMITNQSVIGRGLASREEVMAVNEKVLSLLWVQQIEFQFVLFCPHMPEDFCDCRKPAPGLGNLAIKDYNINPSLSYMIGDQPSDVGFGHAIGFKSILIGDDIEVECEADHYAKNVLNAAEWISSEMKRG